ncbi:FAD-dependent monooxygenase [Nocardia amikacinitolerans]|uniref:FAD-dependent monooxygenase n=1 Tax=Nocardia amikacinitolerans TaxID=756689 RepID=UPI0020A495A2|nr:FAD-dependent monooxygenase [Nocardia amikacinitolerans]MCP2280984.1 2-polyprenyl-6-methoxyphenol hydroxylase [Nocardia amikacinitolerans]MCP2297995.1 2-polyprenyl-6-methoxyphenol hydroxylase [Nocardia amikacinitolerans]
MTDTPTDVDVIVVGGGPSGLTVAAEIAASGASVRVLEKRNADPISRAGTLLPRPLELFDARDIADRFIRRTCEINPHPFQTWHIWGGMHPVDWSSRESRFRFTLFLPQHETELILRGWATEQGVDLRFGNEVTDLAQSDRGVTVTSTDPHGLTRTTRARYVIGADGGQSAVRRLSRIAFEGRDATFTGIIADAELEFPWQGGLRVGHNEHGWLTTFPFGPGLTRFTVVHAEGRAKAKSEPVTADEVARYVSEILEEQVRIPALRGASRYTDAQRIAARFRHDRVFLVGESARIHYPASGIGMNYCLQDAFNLGWKIGAVLGGFADESLLDTYESERRPISLDLLRTVDAQVAIQFDFSPEGLALTSALQEHFLPLPDVTARLHLELNGLETRYPCEPGSHPQVGQPVADFELMLRDGHSIRLYELLHDQHFVLIDISGTQALRDVEFPGMPIRVVEAHPVRRPPALDGVTMLLVRPDTYLAWASVVPPSVETARAQVSRWLHEQNDLHPATAAMTEK